MSTVTTHEVDRTRTESIVDAHDCDWTIGDGEHGRCGCGLIVTSEDEWRHHAEQAVIAELWSPTAELITSAPALERLPERSVIVVHPGKENAVFRRIVLGDPSLSAWCNLTGTFRFTPGLLPAVALERGPGTPPSQALADNESVR